MKRSPHWQRLDQHLLTIGGGGGDAFTIIAVAGESNVVADTAADTLTLIAGTNMTLTTNAGADEITFDAAGASVEVERVRLFAALSNTAGQY
ncbi:cell wall-associated hydrolase [uncultured Mediterranean phage]|nr:cell wall-associated hydrolase [uncultured Mediterranean phage]